jgi:predicted transcriptional regulator
MMTTLVEWLEQQQRDLGERDVEFARRLGVTQATWCRLRKRNRQPGLEVVLAAFRAFPSRTDDVLRRVLEFPTSNKTHHTIKDVA